MFFTVLCIRNFVIVFRIEPDNRCSCRQLYGPDPQYCIGYEMARARHSLASLLDYGIQQVNCVHGGRYEGDGRRRIAELLKQEQ